MSRVSAIVLTLMFLGGALAGALALRVAQAGGDARARQPTPPDPVAVSLNEDAARMDAGLTPLYDIPKLDRIQIDGKGDDWGNRGFRVNMLANASGKVQPRSDIDASFRLGWNDRGLLVLVTVHDDVPFEDLNPINGDSVELLMSPRRGAEDMVRAIIGPGIDPTLPPEIRTRVQDLRKTPSLKKHAVSMEAVRTRTDDGYVIEALLPWSNLGLQPLAGREIGFQLQVNDLDASSQGSRLVWYPSLRTLRDSTQMHRLRLANRPSPAVRCAAFGDYPRFHRTRIVVAAEADLAGQKVEVRQGDRVMAGGKLEPDFVRPELASVHLSLPMALRGHPYGQLDVLVDGRRITQLDLPDPGDMAKWIMPYEEYVFKPCVFCTRAFPEGDFDDPSYVEDLIGSYEAKVTYYDADYNAVTTAEKPGRYGAVVEVHSDDGKVWKRYRTLFREPKDFSWRNTDIPFTVKLPKEMGIDAAAIKQQSRSVSEYFKDLLGDEGINHDESTAVLLAGLYETHVSGGGKAVLRNTPQSMDRKWWAGLKLKIGEPAISHLTYLPVGYDLDPKKRWPVILFLHGKGERGDSLDMVKQNGIPALLEYSPEKRKEFPFIVIAPQCPQDEWWSSHELAALLDQAAAQYRVDADRVYVTGMSMGGYGTWALATEFPDRFAAIVPVCGGGDPQEAERLKNLPVWTFHGDKDNVVPITESKKMVDALTRLGGDVKFTILPQTGHDAWDQAYSTPELYTWLLQHHRRSQEASTAAAPAVPH